VRGAGPLDSRKTPRHRRLFLGSRSSFLLLCRIVSLSACRARAGRAQRRYSPLHRGTGRDGRRPGRDGSRVALSAAIAYKAWHEPQPPAAPFQLEPEGPATRYDPGTCLVVVDVQNDFADPAGSLYVSGGAEIVPLVNAETGRALTAGAAVVYTADWHPEHTPHFAQDGGIWPSTVSAIPGEPSSTRS